MGYRPDGGRRSGMTNPSISPGHSPAPARLLLVDDEASILASLKRLFRALGYTIFTATSARAGLELLAVEPIDLVISDMRMPELDGAQFLEQVFARWPAGWRDTSACRRPSSRMCCWRRCCTT